MEGLSGIVSSLGQNNNWQKLLTGGLFASGEVGNILEQRKKMQYQNFINDLVSHPEKLAAMAAKLQKPLDSGLVQGVTNTVQGDLAQRGLSQAPGIFAATESQALAPYQQQNADRAMQAVLSTLGLPAGTFGQPANLGGSLQAFLNSFKKPAGSGSTGTVGDPGLTPPIDWSTGKDAPV